MPLNHLLEHHAERCHRPAWLVVLASVLIAALSGFYAAHHLRVSTDTDDLFAPGLPWRQRRNEQPGLSRNSTTCWSP